MSNNGDPKLDRVLVDDVRDWSIVGGGVDVRLTVTFGGDFISRSTGEINRDFAAGSPSVFTSSNVQSLDTFSTSLLSSTEAVSSSDK